MGWIENRPNKFLNQNFVRQGPPAKCKTRRFRYISLIYLTRKNLLRRTLFLQPTRQRVFSSTILVSRELLYGTVMSSAKKEC